MRKLARQPAKEKEQKKISLTDDRFYIAADKIEDERVGREMPDAVMQKHRADELPGVGVPDTGIADAKVNASEPGLIRLDHQLRDKHSHVRANQPQQNHALRPRPRFRKRRGLPTRQTHAPRVSHRQFLVDFKTSPGRLPETILNAQSSPRCVTCRP